MKNQNCKWEIKTILIRSEKNWKWYVIESDQSWNLMLEATGYGTLMFCLGWGKQNDMTLDETIEMFRNNVIRREATLYKQEYLRKHGDGETLDEYEDFYGDQG